MKTPCHHRSKPAAAQRRIAPLGLSSGRSRWLHSRAWRVVGRLARLLRVRGCALGTILILAFVPVVLQGLAATQIHTALSRSQSAPIVPIAAADKAVSPLLPTSSSETSALTSLSFNVTSLAWRTTEERVQPLSARSTAPGAGRLSAPPPVSCDGTKALSDPANQNCQFSRGDPNNVINGVSTVLDLICVPDGGSAWLANNPQVYDCQVGHDQEGVGEVYDLYYCNVPTDVVLNNAAVRCSLTNGGTLLPCIYPNYMQIEACIQNNCGTAQDTNTYDLVTGLPFPSQGQNNQPPICAVTVPASCTNPFDPQNDWIMGSIHGLLFTSLDHQTGLATYDEETVPRIWASIAAIALAMLGIPFVLAGYQIILGLGSSDHAKAIERFGRVILVAVAIAMSLFILEKLIDLEDGLVQYFSTSFQQASYATMPSSNWGCYTKQFFGNLFNLNIYSTMNAAQEIDITTFTRDMASTTLLLIENLPNYVLTLLSVLLAIQLVLRLALLILHIVLSPLTILCAALPHQIGPAALRHWVRGFVSLLAMQVLQLIVLVLGSTLIPASAAPGANFTTPATWTDLLFSKLIPILVVLVTLNIPRLLNAPATALLATVSSSLGGAMSGIALIIRGL